MFKTYNIITAIEVGTATIKVLMGKPSEDGSITVIGYDEVSSIDKVIKGEVVNVPAVEELLSQALNNVETVSGERIRNVYVAISGGHIQSTNVIGSVPITSPDRIITDQDIIEATRNARSYNLPMEQKDIHTFQRTYVIDDSQRASNPEGMGGNKLTADIHLIFGNYNKIQTLCTLINDVLGTPANDISFTGIADFYGISAQNGHGHGKLIIDIGAGITEYVVFYKDGCIHSGQITVGCEHVANDLSIALRLPITKCREILKQLKPQGFKLLEDETEKIIEVQMNLGQDSTKYKQSVFRTVIKLRLKELLELIKDELMNTFLDDDLNMTSLLGDGIVLCGGGALIPEITELTKTVFNTSVEIGLPVKVSGIEKEINSPRYITPVGLLHLGHRLNILERESLPTFRQTLESELKKIVAIGSRAFRF